MKKETTDSNVKKMIYIFVNYRLGHHDLYIKYVHFQKKKKERKKAVINTPRHILLLISNDFKLFYF